ncbi:hypothetical protein [Bradyrhizobium sp. CCBAU 53380]|uniref:hypothetical protein n=1 Tax=Bradyrhizobium sp. CCBAU 53380 TaxID=1325117 RepID=UPI00230279F3|nr:hypothetical protein [Bradyrhizobium sp. CCBAU 53380]
MTKEVTTIGSDGFDGCEDRVEGDGRESAIRVIQGSKWSFTQDCKWVDDSDQAIPADTEVTVVGIERVIQKWVDDVPVETRFIPHGELIPNIEKLNAACPKEEWGEDVNGKPRGPWQFQYVLYAVDTDMGKITFPTGTVGGKICISELRDKVVNMRKFRGEHVYPVVSPSTAWMNTKFGGRNRPDFKVKRWISFGCGDGVALAAPAPVAAVTAAEELNDEVPF